MLVKGEMQGFALIMDKEASRALLEWTPINKRLQYIRLNSRFTKSSIVMSYAPIEGAEEDAKDDFYNRQAAVERILIALMCFCCYVTAMQE